VVAAQTVAAIHTRRMVMHEDPVADFEGRQLPADSCRLKDILAQCNYFSRRLMADYEGSFFFYVPRHHISRTDTAGPCFYQRIARTHVRDRHVLYAYIGKTV
jgi:hypothetical protein